MRQRIKRNTGAIIASSDYSHVRASKEVLAAGHEERKKAISMMTFSVKPTTTYHYGRPYVKVWGKKLYIPEDRVNPTEQCGIKVYWD